MFFFCRVNFIELKLFGLLSFGFSFGSWFWARNGTGELFLVMLCSQKEACLRCLLRKNNHHLLCGKTLASKAQSTKKE